MISKNTLDNNTLLQNNQDWQKRNLASDRENFLQIIWQWVCNAPIRIKIINEFFKHSNYTENIYIAQGTIARIVGCSRTYVNMVIHEFVAMGMIMKQYRARKTCFYWLNPVFYQKAFRETLKTVFINFTWTPKLILTTFLLANPTALPKQPINSNCKTAELTLSFSLEKEERVNYKYRPSDYLDLSRAREQEAAEFFRKKEETLQIEIQGENLKQFRQSVGADEVVPRYIIDLIPKDWHFSKWAQMKTTAFPREAIETVVNTGAHFKPKDRFAWFLNQCMSWCKSNDLSPDWSFADGLKLKYKMPKDARMIIQPKVEPRKPWTEPERKSFHDYGQASWYREMQEDQAQPEQRDNIPFAEKLKSRTDGHDKLRFDDPAAADIKLWEEWLLSPIGKQHCNFHGFTVMPHVLEHIAEGRVDLPEIGRLVVKYPPLKSIIDKEMLARKKGHSTQASAKTIQSVLKNVMGGFHNR